MCMIDSVDGDWVTLKDSRPRARKAYRCYECDRTITPGEQYHYVFGTADGSPVTTRECAHCAAAAQWLIRVCRGYLFGGIREDLREHWDESWELRHVDLGRLVLWGDRGWRRRDGALIDVERVRRWAQNAPVAA